MIYVGWLIWLVGSIISIGWAYTIRTQTRNGSFLMQSTINLNMLFLVSLIAILFLQVTPLHLLWLFPVSIVLSMLSLFRPFSLISIPGKLFGQILCVGIDWEEAAAGYEKNQELKVQATEMLKQGMTQEEVREWFQEELKLVRKAVS